MKKYLLIGMVVALSLLTACGKKDFSKMSFNDGEYQGHFNNDDKDHPSTADVVLTIQDGKIVKFTINGKPFDPNATYRVATSDYLFNGGDAMYFFGNPIQKEDTGYKIRNVLIDYFKQADVIDAKEDHRFEYKP